MELERRAALPLDRIALGLAIALFAVVAIRCAWLCDDAFITFRTVDNFANGYGLRWNVAERVQSYTHPLWMVAIAVVHGVSGEFYYGPIVLSLVLSVAAVIGLATRVCTSTRVAILVVVVLGLSKAFVDYSTSGLENPLTHLLLVVFLVIHFSEPDPDDGDARNSMAALTFVAALAVVNRMDVALLLAPGLLWRLARRPTRGVFAAVAIGALPFLAWELFSLVYYGFPFPNTAYAKLGTGVAADVRWLQGARYLENSLFTDPLTLCAVAAGLASAALRREAREVPIAIGVALHLVYLLSIGGDFMSGRMLTAPLLASLALVGRSPAPGWRGFATASIAIVALGLGSPNPTWWSGAGYGVTQKPVHQDFGIADERAYYYPHTGLLRGRVAAGQPIHPWLIEGRDVAQQGHAAAPRTTVGFYGFGAGPSVYVVDLYALGDPLLARLPASEPEHFRIGHHHRRLPDGYAQSVRDDRNQIAHPALARYYDALLRITRGPLFDPQRLRDVVAMNLGRYDGWIDAYAEDTAALNSGS